jgi:LacI family transcriptional regulator
MNKRITIKDIARELNIHHSTVSRALRKDPRVKEKTREIVLAYAQEHEYQTNMNAVQLRGTSNNAIALIVPNINHNFFSDIVSKLTNLAYDKGYVISVFQTNEKYELEKEIVNTIIQHNFAGVIVSIANDTKNSNHFRLLEKFGIPLVFFDRVCEDISSPKVLVNNREITFQATEHLINKGYKRIVHITGDTDINVFRDRQKGYLEALEKYAMDYRNPMVIKNEFTTVLGKNLLTSLLVSDLKPDAIISSSIYLTMGILLKCREMKLNVPADLGIITFGTLLSTEIITPQITSIEQPETEIAELSFELLEKQINHEIVPDKIHDIIVKAEILFRESC